MSKKALIIRHSILNDLWTLAEVLQQQNITYDYVDSFIDDIKQYDPLAYDLVIAMGGAFGVPDKDDYPCLGDEITFLKARVEKDLPTFGVCLGAQLIAAALGAEVYPGKAGFELGWAPLTLTEDGKNSPMRHLAPDLTQMFFSHGDTFDLPHGARLLASSDMYQRQAFSYGDNVLAVQFHPEIQPALAYDMMVSSVSRLTGKDAVTSVTKLRRDTDLYIDKLQTQTKLFFTEWLSKVL